MDLSIDPAVHKFISAYTTYKGGKWEFTGNLPKYPTERGALKLIRAHVNELMPPTLALDLTGVLMFGKSLGEHVNKLDAIRVANWIKYAEEQGLALEVVAGTLLGVTRTYLGIHDNLAASSIEHSLLSAVMTMASDFSRLATLDIDDIENVRVTAASFRERFTKLDAEIRDKIVSIIFRNYNKDNKSIEDVRRCYDKKPVSLYKQVLKPGATLFIAVWHQSMILGALEPAALHSFAGMEDADLASLLRDAGRQQFDKGSARKEKEQILLNYVNAMLLKLVDTGDLEPKDFIKRQQEELLKLALADDNAVSQEILSMAGTVDDLEKGKEFWDRCKEDDDGGETEIDPYEDPDAWKRKDDTEEKDVLDQLLSDEDDEDDGDTPIEVTW